MSAFQRVGFAEIRGRRVLAALSGGADSTALLHLLASRREEDALCLFAAHFNHRIRGAEADADEAFCRVLCQKLEIPLICGGADVPAIAAEKKLGLETCARELRYEFLRNAKTQCGADLIALAHHADDQAETVLMHLLRGTGPDGICGMTRVSGDLYRPLLELRHADLIDYLKSLGAGWREDSTNAVADSPRNALRLNVLPTIEKSYPQAANAIGRYAVNAQIESEFLAGLTDSFLKSHLRRGVYGQKLLLKDVPAEAILRRAIRKICGAELSAAKLDALTALARQNRGKTCVYGDLIAERTPDALYFLPKSVKKPAEVPLNVPGETVLAGVCRITVEIGTFPMDRTDASVEVVDADALEGAILRTWRQGDRMRPLGAPGDRLLSDCMTDRRIDRPIRCFLPLIAVGNRVLWADGLGISDTIRIQTTTRRTVRLKIQDYLKDNAEVNDEK